MPNVGQWRVEVNNDVFFYIRFYNHIYTRIALFTYGRGFHP